MAGAVLAGDVHGSGPVALGLLVQLAPGGHEVGAEGGKYGGQVGQGLLLHGAQHQGVADSLDLDVLRRVEECQFLGDANGQRVAAFEDAGVEHGGQF